MKSVIAACIFATFTVVAILFEIALAAGMPWGEFAWGGNYPGTLPSDLRVYFDLSARMGSWGHGSWGQIFYFELSARYLDFVKSKDVTPIADPIADMST